ncbi:MAG TPA: ABC transporter substrate-binding protein [Dissulfurispiraceae bacterium]
MKLRIGHLSTFYHTAILLMAEGSVDRQLGASAEWKLFGTGPAIVNAFERGELDLAYIGLPPAIIGIARGVAIKCIGGGHVEGTVISAKGRYAGFPRIQSLADILKQFRGLKIGVPGKGSIHDVIITDCLEKHGLKESVGIVNFPWADQVLEAVVRDEVAAAVGTPALAAAVKRYAGGKVLYPPSMLWPDNPSYGILAHTRFLGGQRELAEGFLRMHEDATAFLRNNPEDAAKTIAGYVGIVDKELVLDTLSISPRYCARLTEGYISSTMEFVRALRRLGYIQREVSSDEIFDPALIDKVHPERDHY